MITRDNIASHELIGLHATITLSTNGHLVGLNGRIIDETKSMIRLETARGRKSIPKENSTWEFMVEGARIPLCGKNIAKRPFDRPGSRA